MKGGHVRPRAGSAPAEPLPGLGNVRDPLIVRTRLAPSPSAAPILFRPNDPLIAADVRVIASEIVVECLEAGSAEVVSELAMPLQAHALALVMSLSADHADEWISWGLGGLDYDPHAEPAVGRRVVDYVDRQLINARRSRALDFFAALDRTEVAGRRLAFDTRRRLASRLLSEGRAGIIAIIADALEWLAAEPESLHRLQSDRDFVQQSADSLLAALPNDVGDGPMPCSFIRQHARLLLRALLTVLAERVQRLTVIRRQPAARTHPLEWHSLLIAFMPRDDGD